MANTPVNTIFVHDERDSVSCMLADVIRLFDVEKDGIQFLPLTTESERNRSHKFLADNGHLGNQYIPYLIELGNGTKRVVSGDMLLGWFCQVTGRLQTSMTDNQLAPQILAKLQNLSHKHILKPALDILNLCMTDLKPVPQSQPPPEPTAPRNPTDNNTEDESGFLNDHASMPEIKPSGMKKKVSVQEAIQGFKSREVSSDPNVRSRLIKNKNE